MDAKAEVESIRAAFSPTPSCTADTIAALRRLLDVSDVDKENLSQDPKQLNGKPARRPPNAASKGVKGRQVGKGSQQSSKGCLSAKEQQNLATELFNKTLKILTDAVRNPASRAQKVAGRPVKGHVTSEQASDRLATVAVCSRLALTTLRQIRGTPSDSNLHLEQGTCALIGKLLSLKLHAHAEKELVVLKRLLEHSNAVKTSVKGASVLPLAEMLCLNMPDYAIARLRLAVQFQASILRLLSTAGASVDEESMSASLDPMTTGSPSWIISKLHSAGAETSEIARVLETLAQLLKAFIRSDTRRDPLTPGLVFRIETIILQVRRTWWTVAGHTIDIAGEVIEPLRASLKDFSSRSKLKSEVHYRIFKSVLSPVLSWDLFNNLDGENRRQFIKMTLEIFDFAETSGHTKDARSWLSLPEEGEGNSGKALSLQKLVRQMKKLPKLDERILQELLDFLRSCETTQPIASDLRDEVSTVRRVISSFLVKGCHDPPSVQILACKTLFLCIRVSSRCHHCSTSARSLLDSGILTSSIWLKCLQTFGDEADPSDLLEEQDLLRTLAAKPDFQKEAASLTTFSDLQWHLYKSLQCRGLDKPYFTSASGDIRLLTSAVNILSNLKYLEREAAKYIDKSSDLVTKQIADRLHSQACQSLANVFKHMSHEGGMLSNLKLALAKLPLPQALKQCDSHGVLQRIIALTRQLGKETKQPCMEKVLASVPSPLIDTVYYIWIMTSTKEEVEHIQADFYACVSTVIAKPDPIESPVHRMQVFRHVLGLSLASPLLVDSSLVTASLACQPLSTKLSGDVDLARYANHIEKAWNFAIAVYDLHSNAEACAEMLEWWDRATRSELAMQDIDDPEALAQLLLYAYPVLEIRGHHSLARLAIQITDRICKQGLGTRSSGRLSLGVLLARSQMALTDGDLLTAETCLNDTATLRDLPGSTLSQRLQLAETIFRTDCVSSSRDKIYQSLARALGMAETSGLKRVDKSRVFRFQARLGYYLADYLYREGRTHLSAPIARGSLLLLKSVAATVSEFNAHSKPRSEPSTVDESVGIITDSLMKLDIGEGTEKPSTIRDSRLMQQDWPTESQMVECLLLLTQICTSLGNKQDAQHYLEQAERSIEGLGMRELYKPLITEDLRLQVCSGMDRSNQPALLPSAISHCDPAGIESAALNLAWGDWCARFEGGVAAFDHYAMAEKVLIDVSGESTNLDPQASGQRTKPTLKKGGRVASHTTRSTREAATIGKTPASKRSKAADSKTVNVHMAQTALKSNFRRTELLAAIHCQRALAFMKDDNLLQAAEALANVPSGLVYSHNRRSSIANARLGVAQTTAKLLMDVNYSTLLESTMAVPSTYVRSTTNLKDNLQPNVVVSKLSKVSKSIQSHNSDVNTLPERIMQDIARPGEVPQRGPLSEIYEMSSVSLSASMLSLAVNGGTPGPNAWHMASILEMPSCEAFRRQVLDVRSEAQKANLVQSLHSAAAHLDQPQVVTPFSFHEHLVKAIPKNWIVTSITMNEEGTELWVGRYVRDHSPLVIRLPMTRSRDQDIDEGLSFDYQTAQQELVDIIKASDYSCHHPPNTNTKGGKSKWWQDRESLDERMHDLLKNMESIWFGGFKSLLSVREPQSDLLARFQKSIEVVLDKHLPSRRGSKAKTEKTVLHPQVVSLFLGLDVDDEDGLDENVMDLLFFVIDVLQCNGEANAYDEVDFDAMAVETLAAMQAYYDTSVQPEKDEAHLILRLDKRLHSFPWESMPCLQGLSISRVSSLNQLHERLLLMRSSCFITPRTGGTYMLNPSGDLSRTEATLSPALAPLAANSGWTSSVRTRPDEKSFTAALSSSSALLYFGHGSGAQYVRPRAIERLPSCSPVVWLMGCSSGTPTENGQLETTSVPLSYLAAGRLVDEEAPHDLSKGRDGLCMAVVATLWDVTDRDIDKFSLAVGERWGLFPPGVGADSNEAASSAGLHPPKTPRGKRKDALLPPASSTLPPKTPGKTPARALGKTPAKTPAKTPGRNKKKTSTTDGQNGQVKKAESLTEAVAKSRDVCYLRYLNGAASVVYGVPVYLEQ